MRMNMVLLKERLKPYQNEGFNCKDRKTTRSGKIWVKGDKLHFDYGYEQRVVEVRKLIREGTLCKNVQMLRKGVEMAGECREMAEILGEDIREAKVLIEGIIGRRREIAMARLLLKNIHLPKGTLYVDFYETLCHDRTAADLIEDDKIP